MAGKPFGTRLRSLRGRAGMTQTVLAQKVGVSQGNVTTWERNAAVPPLAMVEQLAAILGVSAAELLTGRPEISINAPSPSKLTIRLTADNFTDHLSIDYAASLVRELAVPEHGIDYDDWLVTKLVAWVELESRRLPDVQYEISRLVAAVLLEQLARRR